MWDGSARDVWDGRRWREICETVGRGMCGIGGRGMCGIGGRGMRALTGEGRRVIEFGWICSG